MQIFDRIEAVLAGAVEGSSKKLDEARELVKKHQNVTDGSGLMMAHLEPELLRALALALDARDRGEVVTAEVCGTRFFEIMPLATALVETAPRGDRAQLGAAIWLAHRVEEAHSSLLAAVYALKVAHDAVKRLRADGTPPTEAMKGHGWPADFIVTAYARDTLCLAERIEGAMGVGSAPGMEAEIIERDKGELYHRHNELLKRLVALKDRPNEAVAELVRDLQDAAKSDVELVKLLATTPRFFKDVERMRQDVEDYLTGSSQELEVPASIEIADMERFARDLPSLVFVDGGRGVRVLGIHSAHPWAELGFTNGDVLVSLNEQALTADSIVRRLNEMEPGGNQLVIERGGRSKTLSLVNNGTQVVVGAFHYDEEAEPEPTISATRVAKSRVADARALRLALQRSGLDLSWQESVSGYAVSGVREGALAADLGLRDGDVLKSLGGRSASSAHEEEQGGIGYLVDGLGDGEVDVEILRGGAFVKMRWRFE